MQDRTRLPRHIAVIMDGNGRWARDKGLPRLEGHRQGAARARELVEWAADAGIQQVSLFAFSTENWLRPKVEVRGLMSMLATLLPREIPLMQEKGVRVRTLGNITGLPDKAQRAIRLACQETAGNKRIELVLCLNYGGQQEVLDGAKRMAAWAASQDDMRAALDSVDVEGFRHFLWSDELPPVDLLIRTGGEHRISNFFLWDAAYCELYFSKRYWPDFGYKDFLAALDDYAHRERRFGLTSEQLPDKRKLES